MTKLGAVANAHWRLGLALARINAAIDEKCDKAQREIEINRPAYRAQIDLRLQHLRRSFAQILRFARARYNVERDPNA
jgi:hypothetical protein